ncbi:hypothetical protein K438DRAFT_1786683 [Mycena galopus ATCC 62051]|nr:hypothetical protein K438DRAFT_1786683 [Mycena galopus ATCC 62051]
MCAPHQLQGREAPKTASHQYSGNSRDSTFSTQCGQPSQLSHLTEIFIVWHGIILVREARELPAKAEASQNDAPQHRESSRRRASRDTTTRRRRAEDALLPPPPRDEGQEDAPPPPPACNNGQVATPPPSDDRQEDILPPSPPRDEGQEDAPPPLPPHPPPHDERINIAPSHLHSTSSSIIRSNPCFASNRSSTSCTSSSTGDPGVNVALLAVVVLAIRDMAGADVGITGGGASPTADAGITGGGGESIVPR